MTDTSNTKLDRIIAQLEVITDILRDEMDTGRYPTPPYNPKIPDLSNTCPQCGISFTGTMAYACVNSGCPMGCGPRSC